MSDENTTVSMVSGNARMKEVARAAAILFLAINGWNRLNSVWNRAGNLSRKIDIAIVNKTAAKFYRGRRFAHADRYRTSFEAYDFIDSTIRPGQIGSFCSDLD